MRNSNTTGLLRDWLRRSSHRVLGRHLTPARDAPPGAIAEDLHHAGLVQLEIASEGLRRAADRSGGAKPSQLP
jgi:hypothetical protein